MAAFQARPVSRAGLSEVTVGGGGCGDMIVLLRLHCLYCYTSYVTNPSPSGT